MFLAAKIGDAALRAGAPESFEESFPIVGPDGADLDRTSVAHDLRRRIPGRVHHAGPPIPSASRHPDVFPAAADGPGNDTLNVPVTVRTGKRFDVANTRNGATRGCLGESRLD